VFTDHVEDPDVLAGRLAAAEALVLIRERTAIHRATLERLPQLRLISQRSVRVVAGYGRAFGMKDIVWGSEAARLRAAAEGHNVAASKEAFIATCEVLSLHVIAVDVYESEPVVDPTDPLLTLDNALCTPHLGYVTLDEWELQFADIFDQINAYSAGTPINVVNPQVLANLRSQIR
jgi:phosphoglycerate dehydrogenase-like enzyme